MLYIEQPELQGPKVVMQEQFASAHHSQPEMVKDKVNHAPLKEVSFQKLSIREKINYLLNVPEQIPALRCEVVTESDTWIGVVMEIGETDVMLRLRRNGIQHVPIEDITAIRLIGF